jgi:hypothetical protein
MGNANDFRGVSPNDSGDFLLVPISFVISWEYSPDKLSFVFLSGVFATGLLSRLCGGTGLFLL